MIGGDWLGLHYVVSIARVLRHRGAARLLAAQRLDLPGRGARRPRSRATCCVARANLPLSLAGMFVFVDLAGLPVPIASAARHGADVHRQPRRQPLGAARAAALVQAPDVAVRLIVDQARAGIAAPQQLLVARAAAAQP